MVYAYCVDKKSENGNIIEYKLKDFEGNVQIFKSNLLKAMIDDGSICVVNLTLTSDNKLRSHTIPTLNDVLNPEKNSNNTALNLNNVFNQNRPLLHNVEPQDCYLYKHKLFFKSNGLNILDVNNQDVVKIIRHKQTYYFNNIIYIPNGNCLNIIAETEIYGIDYGGEEVKLGTDKTIWIRCFYSQNPLFKRNINQLRVQISVIMDSMKSI